MRFGLLGDHPDGLAMTRALVESGRHQLVVYAGPAAGAEYLRRWGLAPPRVVDLEEVLADPGLDAVIVAATPANRAGVLRRAVQSERHVLCVHPADQRADTAYEAAMIRAETGRLLFPILPEAMHPAVRRLTALLRMPEERRSHLEVIGKRSAAEETAVTAEPPPRPPRSAPSVAGSRLQIRLIQVERWATEHVLLDADSVGHKAGLPGWDVLRALGGEVAEVAALAPEEELDENEPLLLSGSFEGGGLFQTALLPRQAHERWSVTVVAPSGSAHLDFPEGWPGPARLSFIDDSGVEHNESFESWDPWPALVEAFESALANSRARQPAPATYAPRPNAVSEHITTVVAPPTVSPVPPAASPFPTWQDEIRCLELDDAARRSVARRRASTLDYQEATEEASFKGTMTLVGCGLLWTSLMLLILSVWVPWLGWFIAPVFGFFIIMQLLRWVVPPKPETSAPQDLQIRR